MKSKYKIKNIPLLLIIFFVIIIDIFVLLLAKDFGIVLVIVWISGSIPSLFVFYTVSSIVKLVHLFRTSTISFTGENRVQKIFLYAFYKALSVLIGGLLTSSTGVILYYLILSSPGTVNLLSPVVDLLRTLPGQALQYTEVYYMLGGCFISFLAAIPGMILARKLMPKKSTAQHEY